MDWEGEAGQKSTEIRTNLQQFCYKSPPKKKKMWTFKTFQDQPRRSRGSTQLPNPFPALTASQGAEAPAPHDEIFAPQPVARHFHEDPPHGHRHAEDTACDLELHPILDGVAFIETAGHDMP